MSRGFTPLKTIENPSSGSTDQPLSPYSGPETSDRFRRADTLARELRSTLHAQGAFVALRVKGQSVFVCWASSGQAPAVGKSVRLSPEIEAQCASQGYALVDLPDRKGFPSATASQTVIVLFSDSEEGGVLGIAPRENQDNADVFDTLRRQAELCVAKVMPDAIVCRPPVPVVVDPPAPMQEIEPPVPVEISTQRETPSVEVPAFLAHEDAEEKVNRRMSLLVGAACVAIGFGIITSAALFARSSHSSQTQVASLAKNSDTTPALPVSTTASETSSATPQDDLGIPAEDTTPKPVPTLNAQVRKLPITNGKDVNLNRGFPQVVAPEELSGTTPRVEFSSQEFASASPLPASDVPPSTFTPAPTVKDSVPIFDLSRTFKAHSGWVTGVAFNSAGRLVSSGWDRQLKVWDVNSGQALQSFSPGGKRVQAIAYSNDGRRIAVQAEDGSVHVLDASGHEINRMMGDEGRSKDSWVYSIGFSPDGKWLAAALGNKTVRVWDVNSGRVLHDLIGSKRPVIYVAFSPGGRMLATGADEKTIAIWDVATGSLLRTLKGHSKSVNAVAFSPNGRWLASASDDKTVRVWDYVTGREIYALHGHKERVSCLAFGPGGKWLASGGWDGELRVWDMASGQRVEALLTRKKSVFSLAVEPGGRWLASGTQDGTISLWHLREGRTNSGGE